MSYLDILGKALNNPTEANLLKAQAAMQQREESIQKQVSKMEEAQGKLPDPVALSQSAPTILPTKGRTPQGSAISRMNAVKHGILSEVIPEQEQLGYTVHVGSIFDTYKPVGYLEQRLCERIASSLWRLQRLERFESALVSRDTAQAVKAAFTQKNRYGFEQQHRSIEDIQSDFDETAQALEMMQKGVESMRLESGQNLFKWLWAFYDLADTNSPKFRKAEKVLEKALDQASNTKGSEWTDDEKHQYLTFEMVHPTVTALGQSMEDFIDVKSVLLEWDWCQEQLKDKVQGLERELAAGLKLEQHTLALSGIPHEVNTDKIAKYEAHLERGLYRALHELEAMQDKRNGQGTSPVRVEVHGVGE